MSIENAVACPMPGMLIRIWNFQDSPSSISVISAMILSICFICKVICFWRALICIFSTACNVVCERVFAAALSFVSARGAVSNYLITLMFSDLGSCAGKFRTAPVLASIAASVAWQAMQRITEKEHDLFWQAFLWLLQIVGPVVGSPLQRGVSALPMLPLNRDDRHLPLVHATHTLSRCRQWFIK